jgi:predicted RNA-binding protein Jag
VSEDLFVEATGETVGEAKWAALRALERQRPGIDKTSVRFEVVTEGERGLLGVGYAPARVVATAADVPADDSGEPAPDESELTADVRALVERIAVRCAERARNDGESVELEPMTAVERKVVHLRLKEFDGVETSSEGTEPNRYVVVSPT